MTNIIETAAKDALAITLRSKTALGRLNDAEVHSVLDYLESIGFTPAAPVAPIEPVPPVSAAPIVPAPAAPVVAPVVVPEPVVVVPPAPVVVPEPIVPPVVVAAPPVVSEFAKLEGIIEADIEAFFKPSTPAPAAK